MSTKRTFKLVGAKSIDSPPNKPLDAATQSPLTKADKEYVTARAVGLDFIREEGWRRSGNRIGIPVRDAVGEIVNVRRHLANPKGDVPKTINTKGQGSPTRLVGIDRLKDDDTWVIIAGGEFDWASAISAGLTAVFGSNGEGSLPKIGLDSLTDRRVALALDADSAGQKAANLWAAKLDSIARELRVVSLPDGTDVNDWFTIGRTAEELLALVEASPVHGQTSRRDTAELLAMALEKVEDGGGRDDTGLWLACQLRDERYTRDEAWVILRNYQQAVEHDKESPYSEIAAKVSLDQARSRPSRKPSGKGKR